MKVNSLEELVRAVTFIVPPTSTPADIFPLIPPYIIDCFVVEIGVDVPAALSRLKEFESFLQQYPDPASLRIGPSFVDMSARLKVSADTVFRIFAYGAALGLWKIRTPADFGMSFRLAEEALKAGAILIDGYKF